MSDTEKTNIKKGILKQFKDFLDEYKITGLAIAFIIGAALTALVGALVNDLIMPIITPFIPGGAWREATLALGPIILKWGDFLSVLINFIILAFVVFMMAKWILKEDDVHKR